MNPGDPMERWKALLGQAVIVAVVILLILSLVITTLPSPAL
jgi:hypothetical protein